MRCRTTSTTSRDGAAASRSWGVAALAVSVILLAATGCGDDPVAPGDAPEGHTVLVDGVAHAPGLNTPGTSCASCHGADLRGGAEGQPGCFTCHGRKW